MAVGPIPIIFCPFVLPFPSFHLLLPSFFSRSRHLTVMSSKYTFPHPATAADSSHPKQRKLLPRLTVVSDVEWRADVQRREAVTIDRRRRLDAKRTRDVTEAAGADDQEVEGSSARSHKAKET